MDGTAWVPYLVSLKLLRVPMEVEDQREHVVGLVHNQVEELYSLGDLRSLGVLLHDAFLLSSWDGAEAYSFPGRSWTLHLILYFLQTFRESYVFMTFSQLHA